MTKEENNRLPVFIARPLGPHLSLLPCLFISFPPRTHFWPRKINSKQNIGNLHARAHAHTYKKAGAKFTRHVLKTNPPSLTVFAPGVILKTKPGPFSVRLRWTEPDNDLVYLCMFIEYVYLYLSPSTSNMCSGGSRRSTSNAQRCTLPSSLSALVLPITECGILRVIVTAIFQALLYRVHPSNRNSYCTVLLGMRITMALTCNFNVSLCDSVPPKLWCRDQLLFLHYKMTNIWWICKSNQEIHFVRFPTHYSYCRMDERNSDITIQGTR